MSARKRVASSKKVKGTRPKTTEPIPQTNEEETQPTQPSPQTIDSEPQPAQPTSQITDLEHNPTQPTLEPTSQANPSPQVTQPTSQIIDPKPQVTHPTSQADPKPQPLDNWWNDDSVDDDYDATMDLSDDDSLGGCDWIVEEDDIDLSCSSSDGSVDEDYGGVESEPTRSSSDEELLDARRKVKQSKKRLRKKGDGGEAAKKWQDLNIPLGSGWESEYEEEDLLPNSDSEGEKYDLLSGMEGASYYRKFIWRVGMKFSSPEMFKEMVNKYAVYAGYSVRWIRSENKKKMEAKCKMGCEWKVYASWDGQKKSFMVKSVHDQHTCDRADYENLQAKSRWLAREFLDKFREEPNWPRKSLEKEVLNRFGVKLSKWNCYRVKKHAHRLLHGNLKDHYSKIAAYLNELKRVDEDFRFQLQTDALENDAEHVEHQFKRLYISFPGLRAGFISGCRKVVCIDGCFLKTFLGGQLLCAISRDGNNQMFPICWAVVEAENNEAWKWFLENLKKDLPGFGGEDCTIISDQHKSIMHGVKTIFPDVEHRNCARHIWPSWHKKHRGDGLKEKFWQAVYAYNMADFDLALQEMDVLSTAAVEDFKALKPKTFCRFGFRIHTKCNLVVNNLAETFNGWILESRSKPILGMLEDIRRAVMERLFLKRTLMERAKDDICPRIRKKLETNKEYAKTCHVLASDKMEFEVLCGMEVLIVNLESKSCTCRRWDLTGIPCSHVIACSNWLRMPCEELVDPILKKGYT
ncbi:uncharacterized protein LOC104897696 [Beta vulgaris subsp. vulgaris]|uniref:uncharacterized protein LOC104897696 n=1 Tax=Beta vulgaris subsp. vulgaris TaxID=3555 RepID=UPI002546AB75|nr:uncharacterized protein LOC104897696 [Beta vulgaris subsp. vulgaris]